jgi:PAS domain S-box-containing protein
MVESAVAATGFERLLRGHPRPTWVVDRETFAFLAVNDAAIAIYGYSRDEFLTLTIHEIRPPVERIRLRRYLEEHASIAGEAGRWLHQRKNGEVITVEITTSDITWDGRPALLTMATDVSELERTEQASDRLVDELRLERSRLETLLQHLPVMVAIMGEDGRLRWANRCFEETLGWPLDELRDRDDFLSLFCDDEAAGRAETLIREAEGEWHDGDTRTRDGRVLRTSWADIRLPDGTYVGIGQDVTQRWHEEERLRAILASLTEGVALVDCSGVITFANPAAEDILGLAPLEGRRYDDPAWIISLANGERADVGARLFPRVMAEGVPLHGLEFTVTRSDGSSIPAAFSGAPLRDARGEVSGMVACFADLTELRRTNLALRSSEERFRALIEHAEETTAVFAADGTVLYSSPSARPVLGYDEAELLGQSIFDFIHPEDVDAARLQFGQVVASPAMDVPAPFECRLRHRDGSWVPNRGTARNMLDHPAIRGVVVNARDVTQARGLEQQLLQAQKMEAVGRLAGGVAHDFNNLLTSIQGHADFLLEDLGPVDPLREDAEEILRSSERAAALTRQLLAFSRKQVLQPRVVDPRDVLGGMERLLRRLIGEDVELRLTMPDSVGAVWADVGQLEQVILNLAVNARDAMPTGGRLTLETRDDICPADLPLPEGHGDAGCVLFEISDTGEGIAPDVASKIFEPFFTTKDAGKGTGLGLSTVYGIVEQSGGRITVESQPGAGTTFRIWLPRIEAGTDQPVAQAPPPLEGGGETVLLVEDEDGVRSLARRTLTRLGYEVLEARNGGEALLVCERHEARIDLLLTDVVMPRMSGPELVERLRQVRGDFRVLYMSGYTDDWIANHGMAGAHGRLLEKPFTPEMLGRRVRETLDASRHKGRAWRRPAGPLAGAHGGSGAHAPTEPPAR